MTIARRRRIFYALLTAFFIIGGATILYVSGWRLDFSTLKIGRVGGIFIKSFPQDAEIRIDGKTVKNQSGFFESGTLINNLFPKNYELKLSAGGYYDWQEGAAVSPSLVTEVKYAVLVPKNLLPFAASTTVKNFWLFGNDLLLQSTGGNLYLGGKKLGSGYFEGATNDFEYFLAQDSSGNYFWNDVNNYSRFNISSLSKKSGLGGGGKFKIIVDPYDKKGLTVLGSSKLFLFDASQKKLLAVYDAKNGLLGEKTAASQFFLSWTKFNPESGTSTIFVYDKFLGKTKSAATDLRGRNSDIRWLPNKNLALLQDDGELYLYDAANDNLKKIADDVKTFEFADGGSAVAALEHGALEVISLDGSNYHKFNIPRIEDVKSVEWYSDNNHLFVSYPGYVSFLDLHDGSLKNFQKITDAPVSRYDPNDNRLYFLKDSAVFYLDFPK